MAVYSSFHFFSALVPGRISCIWRINCDDENAVAGVMSTNPVPINNPFHTTVMPTHFRWMLVAIMSANAAATMGYEYSLNMMRQRRSSLHTSQLPFGRGGFEAVPNDEGQAV